MTLHEKTTCHFIGLCRYLPKRQNYLNINHMSFHYKQERQHTFLKNDMSFNGKRRGNVGRQLTSSFCKGLISINKL